jgi:hypothetical protein
LRDNRVPKSRRLSLGDEEAIDALDERSGGAEWKLTPQMRAAIP